MGTNRNNVSQDNICKYIIANYFILYGMDGFLRMMGLEEGAKFGTIILISVIIVTSQCLYKTIQSLDIFILIFLVVMLLTSLFKDYPQVCYINALRGQIFYTLFFFIGRYKSLYAIRIFRNGLLPVITIGIVGIYLYVTIPYWYMSMKLDVNRDMTTNYILEMSRLSAFWPYPYWISYGTCIMYFFLLATCFKKKNMNIRALVILLFFVLIMLLTQQRAPLFFSVGVTIALGFYSFITRKHNKDKFYLYMILFYIVLIIFVLWSLSFMSTEMLERFYEKMDKSSDAGDFLKDRAGIFKSFYRKPITLFGDGIGRYSHAAYSLGKDAITDHQYLKILYESGLWGMFGYGIIIFSCIRAGLKRYKDNIFELGIIFMYLIAMSGANCLATSEEHAAIFWICCGLMYGKHKHSVQISKDEKNKTIMEIVLKI